MDNSALVNFLQNLFKEKKYSTSLLSEKYFWQGENLILEITARFVLIPFGGRRLISPDTYRETSGKQMYWGDEKMTIKGQ